jgi:hypothetical protein
MRLSYAYFQHLPNTVKLIHLLRKQPSYTKSDKPNAYFPYLPFAVISSLAKNINASLARHRGQSFCLFPRNLPNATHRVGVQARGDKQFFCIVSRLALPSLSVYNQRNSIMGNFGEAKQ